MFDFQLYAGGVNSCILSARHNFCPYIHTEYTLKSLCDLDSVGTYCVANVLASLFLVCINLISSHLVTIAVTVCNGSAHVLERYS